MHYAAPTLFQRLKESIDARKEALSTGACDNFDEYKSLTGEIKGLKIALEIARDLLSDPDED